MHVVGTVSIFEVFASNLGGFHLVRTHRGGEGGLMKWPIFAYNKRDRLREMRTRGREGVKNPENFAYVLNGSPLSTNGFDDAFEP